MATRITVKVNTEELQRTLYGSDSKVQQLLDRKAEELARHVRNNAPRSSGDLASSVRVEQASGVDLQFGKPNFTGTTRGRKVVVAHPNAKAVETGTGPAYESLNGLPKPRKPYWPLASEGLVTWALKEAPELVRFNKNGTLNIYLIQKAIHDNGTPARHFMLNALRETFPKATGNFARE